MFCSYCGKQLGDSARFCSFCGKPVTASFIRSAQPVQPVQPVEPVQSVQSVQSVETSHPVELVKPVGQAVEPAEQFVEQKIAEQQISEPVMQKEEAVVSQSVEQTEFFGQTVEQEKAEQQISEPVMPRAEAEPAAQNVEQVTDRPISGQFFSQPIFDRPAETVSSATGKQLNEAFLAGAEMTVNTANVPNVLNVQNVQNVQNVPNVPVKQGPERKYTFAHLMMCLVSTAVFAIAAGIFAGLYFAGL